MAENTSAAKPSGWGKVPEVADSEDEEAPNVVLSAAEKTKERARALAKDVSGRLGPAAESAGRVMRTGVNSVERALADPTAEAASEILAQADLPEISAQDPLLSLALRLDREADLYRGVAMRQLARAAWMDRLGAIASVVCLVGVVVLASIAAFRALFALGDAISAIMLLGVAALLLLMGVFAVGRATSRIRGSQTQAAREALLRADLAEARLHRIAMVLALRESDEEAYNATLRVLEADTRSAG